MPARRSSRHQAVRSHGRVRPVLGVIVTGVVVAALSFVTTTTVARVLLANGGGMATSLACPANDLVSPSACPTAAPAASPGTQTAGSAHPATTGSPATNRPPAALKSPNRSASAGRPPDRTTAASTPPTTGPGSAVNQVLELINEARARAGLADYTITAGLHRSAARHNAVMAAGCGLSHQCPGEPSLGRRETAAGVSWTSAGENIGEGGPVPASTAEIAQMVLVLTKNMLAEQPPDDGHRRNILSTAFRHIGIAIFRDSSGTVWMTQDFSS
jgi:uncharacterized protein YkwD